MPGRKLQRFLYKAVVYVITSLVIEWNCVVYKISISKCIYFYDFNRRLGTLLELQDRGCLGDGRVGDQTFRTRIVLGIRSKTP